MAKKVEVLSGWVSTLGELGVSVAPDVLEAYFKGQQISPLQVNDEVLLAHADAIRTYAATPVVPALTGGSSSVDTADLIGVLDRQSNQVRALGDELLPWVQQKAADDSRVIASVLTSYGPLVMGGIQERLAADPFGAQIANFRQQIQAQLAGVAADAPTLPASSEG